MPTPVQHVSFSVTLLDGTTLQPIPDVLVIVEDLSIVVRTDANGIALMREIPVGTIHLAMTKTGYEPKELDIEVTPGTLNKNVFLSPLGALPTPTPVLDIPTPTIPDTKGNLTLAVLSQSRLERRYGQDRVAVFMDKLRALLPHGTVRGEIVDLDMNPSLRSLFQEWDSSTRLLAGATDADRRQNVMKANSAATAIKTIIGNQRDRIRNESVEYLLLVGSDEMIPHYRLPGLSRDAYSESKYEKRLLDLTHPLGAALTTNHILIDDFYADATPKSYAILDREFYLPDLKIGRLVETPEEMSAIIDAFMALDGKIHFDRAFVAGSDTFSNGADRTKTILEADLGEVNRLSEEGIDPFELADGLNEGNTINVLGLHGDHSVIYRRGGEAALTAQRLSQFVSDEKVRGSVVLNFGSHGGLNVDEDYGDGSEDLVEVFASKGVGAYIGTTAFSGSSNASVGFTEDLASRFVHALVAGKESSTVGEALREAKREYVINEYNGVRNSSLSDEELRQNLGEDEKVVSGMNLYGLPMYTVTSSKSAADPHLALGMRSAEFGVRNGEHIFWAKPKAVGGNLLRSQRIELIDKAFLEEHETGAGRFYSFNGITQANVNEPVQPRAGYITGTEGFFPKGAVLEYARYGVIEGFDPVIEGSQWGAGEVAEGVFTKDGFFPAIPFTVNIIEAQGGLPPLQRFVFVAGQYKRDTSEERLYEELRYSTYYTATETDETSPTINDPSVVVSGDRVLIKIEGSDVDGDPLYRVLLLCTNGGGEWKAEDLKQSSDNPLIWEGSLEQKEGLEFFVQAVDNLGNVSYTDNRGRYYRPFGGAVEPTPTPLLSVGFDETSVEEAGFVYNPASGFNLASIRVGEMPVGVGTNGHGLIIEAAPGEGTLAILSTPVAVSSGPVLVSVFVRAESAGCSVALAALNSPIDGRLGYTNASGSDIPVSEWRRLVLLYDPPSDSMQPGIQVTVPGTASDSVKVYIDNLIISPLSELNFEDVSLDVDGAFDADVTGMMKNVNGNSGSVVVLPDPEGGKNVLLSIEESDDAANIGVFASSLQGSFPHVLEASVDARLLSGSGGVTALVMTNGNGNVGVFVSNSGLPGESESSRTITIGGGFTSENPAFPILCVIQNGGPGVESSVVVDNLTLRRISGGM